MLKEIVENEVVNEAAPWNSTVDKAFNNMIKELSKEFGDVFKEHGYTKEDILEEIFIVIGAEPMMISDRFER